MKHKGFTVVELLVVIVAIGILAGITIVTYSHVRDDAMDTKIKAAVKTAGDAMLLYESRTNSKPTAQGHFNNTNGLEANLMPTYLTPGYRDGITSKNTSHPNHVFKWYNCAETGGIAVYASLNNPTQEDRDRVTDVVSRCGQSATQVPTSGTPSYNYAQTF